MAEMQDVELDTSELEAVEQQIEQQKVENAPQQTEDDDVPEQFRGKSLSEIAKYALATERRLSKQGNELGEVRKLADELIKSQLTKPSVAEPVKEVDFFENPQEAIRQAVENNPKVQAAEQYARSVQMEQARFKLAQMHPDFGSIVQDPAFAEWVRTSKIRAQLYQQAEAYDFDAADELLSTFKQLRAVKQKAVSDVEKKARDTTMQAVAVDTGGSGESTRKIYRRADLIRLKMTNPAKFEAMQDDIDRAYRDGRVK